MKLVEVKLCLCWRTECIDAKLAKSRLSDLPTQIAFHCTQGCMLANSACNRQEWIYGYTNLYRVLEITCLARKLVPYSNPLVQTQQVLTQSCQEFCYCLRWSRALFYQPTVVWWQSLVNATLISRHTETFEANYAIKRYYMHAALPEMATEYSVGRI